LMSSLSDRRRHLRLVEPAHSDPLTSWRSFKRNTLLYARWFLETGELPAGTHFVIAERLAPFVAAVNAAGPEIRAQLLAEVPPIPTPAPIPQRQWASQSTAVAPDPTQTHYSRGSASQPR